MRVPGQSLRQKVTIEPFTGNQGDGSTYGPPVTEPAHVESTSLHLRATTHRTNVPQAVLLLKPGSVVNRGARLTLPDGEAGEVSAVAIVPGPTGRASHLEVEVT